MSARRHYTTSRRALLALLATAPFSACRPVPIFHVPEHAPRRGAAEPQVVLQEIGDYECSFCAEVQPAVNRLMSRYRDRVLLVWRNYPLKRHPHAALAAEAALEVRAQLGDAVFWKYHDVLLGHHQALEVADLERYGKALGIDVERFRRALTVRVHRETVEADRRAIDDLNVPNFGTPAFLIGEDVFIGAYSFEELREIVEEHL